MAYEPTFTRIAESETSHDPTLVIPVRIVLNKQDHELEPGHGFSTHVEVLPEDRPAFLIWGHYDMTIEDALEDYKYRQRRERISV